MPRPNVKNKDPRATSGYARAERIAALTLIGGVPLVFTTRAHSVFTVPKLAYLIAATGLLGAATILNNTTMPARRRYPAALIVPLAALTLPWVVAWIFSEYRAFSIWGDYDGFLGLVPYVVPAATALLLWRALGARIELIARALSVAATVAGSYAVCQRLGIDILTWEDFAVVSTFGNPNFTGSFLAIALPASICGALFDEAYRRWHCVAAAAAIGGIAVSESQAALAAAVVAAAVLAAWWWWHQKRWLAVLLALAAAGGVMAGPMIVLAQRDNAHESITPTTIEQRALWWEDATEMWSRDPITGVGPNVFSLLSGRYRELNEGAAFPTLVSSDPHSVPLSYLVNAGIFGAGGFLAFTAWAVSRFLSSGDPLRGGFVAAIVAYITQAAIATDEVPIRVALAACIVGAVGSSPLMDRAKQLKRSREADEPPSLVHWAAASLSVVAGLGLASWLLIPDIWMKRAAAFVRPRPESAIALTDDARQLSPIIGYDQGFASLIDTLGRNGMDVSDEAADAFSYLDSYPDPIREAAYANILLEEGNVRDATIHFERTLRNDPNNLRATVGLARLAGQAENPQRALDLLDRFLPFVNQVTRRTASAHAEFWGVRATALWDLGRNEEAESAVAKALARDPEQPDALRLQERLTDP